MSIDGAGGCAVLRGIRTWTGAEQSPAHIYQGRGANSTEALPDLPSTWRGGTFLDAHLRGNSAVGGHDQDGRDAKNYAALVRRSSVWTFCKRTVAVRGRNPNTGGLGERRIAKRCCRGH